MPVYRVIRKSDRRTVYAYSNDVAVDFAEYPFADYDHVAEVNVREDQTIAPDPARTVTKLEYLRRYTQTERIAIRAAAAQNAALADYLQMLELAQDINLDDPDTVAAVQMLEAVGLVGAGRTAEILA